MRYDFSCGKCKLVFEVEKGMTAPDPACPRCGGETERHFDPKEVPSVTYANRPTWTYNDCKKYKTCTFNGGQPMAIDPCKHGDLGAWNCPGKVVRKPKKK